jgi:hypothetical protein
MLKIERPAVRWTAWGDEKISHAVNDPIDH